MNTEHAVSCEHMKVLVIGGGGREHALIWKLLQSKRVNHIWCAPGNGGISSVAECIAGDLGDIAALSALADRLNPDLTLIGPELPLVRGLADEFNRKGFAVIGPTAASARLEGSKVFAKEFMKHNGVPTAETLGIFDSEADAYAALCWVDWPVVVKADGLAAGKGVLVTSSPDEATAFIERLMEKNEFGEAGRRVILEERLSGEEISYIVLTDGKHVAPLAAARDYKRLLDGDRGPNTGGMGAVCAEGWLSEELEDRIQRDIVRPTIEGLSRNGLPYCGFLYFGLMLTENGPKVLEFNCRMGDPETQAIVMRMDFDLAEVLTQTAAGKLEPASLQWKHGASSCVVMAAEGYPGGPRIGDRVTGLAEAAALPGINIFHAGTRGERSNIYTSGGRVLAVGCRDTSVDAAVARSYAAVEEISFPGAQYRTDIGNITLSTLFGAHHG
jgi:phosphoribosylamine--glycine ligase